MAAWWPVSAGTPLPVPMAARARCCALARRRAWLRVGDELVVGAMALSIALVAEIGALK